MHSDDRQNRSFESTPPVDQSDSECKDCQTNPLPVFIQSPLRVQKEGASHVAADALNRIPQLLKFYAHQVGSADKLNNRFIQGYREDLDAARLVLTAEEAEMQDGLFYVQNSIPVPASLRHDIIQDHHETRVAETSWNHDNLGIDPAGFLLAANEC